MASSMPYKLTPDILSYICDTLANGEQSDWQTLPALARTCRAFFEPATDRLWSDIPDLAILLFLVPEDARSVEEGETPWGQATGIISLRRALIPSDLTRFPIYTPRIRKLGCSLPMTLYGHISHEYRLNRRDLGPLLQVLHEHRVLPHLRQLELDYSTVVMLPASLGTCVESITLRIENSEALEDGAVLDALREIPHRCPRLLQLGLHSVSESAQYMDAVTNIVPALQGIETFDMSTAPIPLTALQALAAAPRLKKLHVFTDFDDTLLAHTSTEGLFPELAEFSLGVAAPEHALRFLECVSSAHLAEVVIRYQTTPNEGQVRALFDALSSHSRQLRKVTIYGAFDPAFNMAAPRLTESTFESLLALGSLRSLQVTHLLVDIDDRALMNMAKAWPNLTTLSLGVQRWGNINQPRATIYGLLPFIEHCPSIKMIGYRMTTDVLSLYEDPEPQGRPGRGIATDRAIEMHVGDSRIHDPVSVAAFLSDICPKVRYIGHVWRNRYDVEDEEDLEADVDDEEDMYDKWDSVMDFLPHFVRTRKQERAHLSSRCA